MALPLVLERVVGEHHLGKIDPFALPAKLQKGDQPLVEEVALLNGRARLKSLSIPERG